MTSRLATFIAYCSLIIPTVSCSDTPAKQHGPHSDNPQALHILPLGDSITQADGAHKSYRFWLWQRLRERDLAIDFVGTQDSNHDSTPEYPTSFDRNHQGHWGWRSDEVLAKLPTWLPHYSADVALVHLGTNDCLQGQEPAETLAELSAITTTLQQHKPTISIIFYPLGPTSWQGQTCLQALSRQLRDAAPRWSTSSSAVSMATISPAYQVATHSYDGLHPNIAGEQLLAETWLAALENQKPPLIPFAQ